MCTIRCLKDSSLQWMVQTTQNTFFLSSLSNQHKQPPAQPVLELVESPRRTSGSMPCSASQSTAAHASM